jgi:hypothetical protein
MTCWVWICVLWLFAAGCEGKAFSLDREVEAHVKTALPGKVLCLNHPNRAAKLRFDTQGNEESHGEPGPWTTFGLLRVKKVSFTSSAIEIQAERQLLVWPLESPDRYAVIPADRKLSISVNASGADAAEVDKIPGAIFWAGSVEQRFLSEWRPTLDVKTDCDAIKKQKPDRVVGTLRGAPVLACVDKDVTAPKVVSAPEPNYPEASRKSRVQGHVALKCVINEDGMPEIIGFQLGPEEGISENAVKAVSDGDSLRQKRTGNRSRCSFQSM